MPAQILSMELIPGNGNRCKFAEICLEKKLVKSQQVNSYFVAGFSHLEQLCYARPPKRGCFRGRQPPPLLLLLLSILLLSIGLFNSKSG